MNSTGDNTIGCNSTEDKLTVKDLIGYPFDNHFLSLIENVNTLLLRSSAQYKLFSSYQNMQVKMKRNTQNIINNIKKLRLHTLKTYLISGTREWKLIQKYLVGIISPLEYSLYREDGNTRKKVKSIKIREFNKIDYYHERTPMKYIKVLKKGVEWYDTLFDNTALVSSPIYDRNVYKIIREYLI